MNMSGKRDKTKDGKDTRSAIELQLVIDSLTFMSSCLADMKERITEISDSRQNGSLMSIIDNVESLIKEVQERNAWTYKKLAYGKAYFSTPKRPAWKDRMQKAKVNGTVLQAEMKRATSAPTPSISSSIPSKPDPQSLFNALKKKNGFEMILFTLTEMMQFQTWRGKKSLGDA